MKSLRSRLLVAIGLILMLTQGVGIFWVWHESEELVELHVIKILAADELVNINFDSIDDDIEERIEKEIEEELWETVAALFLPASMTLALTIVLIFIAISYLTRPLRQLVQKIESKTPYNLSPLQVENASSEVVVLEKSINRLLQRLEQGLESERRFTADVAHELRTPLAGLRLNLELMDGAESVQAQSLIARIDQMMLSIEQLLQLARAGQKLLKGDAQRFDFVQEVITPMQIEWEEGTTPDCTIQWEVPEKMEMVGDSGLLYLLLRNLLENVRSHASESVCTIVRLSEHADTVALEVIDEGAGVSEEKISLLTQRFTRLDQSRKGHGLGLNIVSRIVMAHQGSLEIKNRDDRSGLHVKVQLPQF